MALNAANSALAQIEQMKKDIEAQRQEDMITTTAILKENVLDAEVKQFERNIKIVGLSFKIKSLQLYQIFSIKIRKNLYGKN